MSENTRYKVGQEVVYPLQGVGCIRAIEEREFKGKKSLYYDIYLEVSDMTVFVPVDRAPELGIRPIVPKEEARQALAIVAAEFEPLQGDWKTRYQINHDLLKQGSVVDIATVVRALYHRSKIKELPVLERKLFDGALKLLIDEISFSLEKPAKEVEQLIFSKLETERVLDDEEEKSELDDDDLA